MASHGFPARRVAALLGVSESGYYAWRSRPPSPGALRRAWLTGLVRDIHQESGCVWGARRIRQELVRRYGVTVGHTTVEALMKGAGLRGRAGRLPGPGPRSSARTSGRRWIVDVLALTTPDGPVYAAVVLDAASRALAGWSTAATADGALVHHALLAAAARTGPAAPAVYGLLPGCSFTERAGSLGCAPAGAMVGDAHDHAAVAAFWDTVQRERDGPCCRPGPHRAGERLAATLDRFARQVPAAGAARPSTP
ncbi:IS3 family transposase [Streptomyces sp. NPDC003674]|uniref:IS3 family transposase n=1 Tax=Streptomyces sp. 1-11 TaxID=2590549 RepID=UPI00117E6A10|nr:IS3 family transposase [Streptomyces sp. 1-11]